jgi:hypothetical protein
MGLKRKCLATIEGIKSNATAELRKIQKKPFAGASTRAASMEQVYVFAKVFTLKMARRCRVSCQYSVIPQSQELSDCHRMFGKKLLAECGTKWK